MLLWSYQSFFMSTLRFVIRLGLIRIHKNKLHNLQFYSILDVIQLGLETTWSAKTTSDALRHSMQPVCTLGLCSNGKLMSQVATDVTYAIICLLPYEILQTAIQLLLVRFECRKLNEAHSEIELYSFNG